MGSPLKVAQSKPEYVFYSNNLRFHFLLIQRNPEGLNRVQGTTVGCSGITKRTVGSASQALRYTPKGYTEASRSSVVKSME